jgi:predicted nucleotide-binding protein
MVEVSEILNSRRPNRQVITRDMRAVNQNSQVPGHLKIIAQVDAARCPFMAAKELARLARHIAVHAEALTIEAPQLKNHAQPSRVFIGHGHSPVWRELKDYIKDDLNLAPDEFNRLPTAGVATVDRLRQMLDASAIALLVLTAEDERQDGAMQARMNVVHEVGLFQGRLGFNRAIVLLEEGCAEFTNIAGIGHIGFPTGRISACFHEVRAVLIREGLVDAGRTNRSVLDL